MRHFTIGEIAKAVGIAPSAIRYYESMGLLPPAQRVSGKRRYDDAVLQQLRVIRLAQAAGFTLAEVQALLHNFPAETPPSERWQQIGVKKLAELEALLARTQAMKMLLTQTLECECATLEQCGQGDSPCGTLPLETASIPHLP